MNIVLDLIASMIVRGAIVYIVITMNIKLHELLYEKSEYVLVKQNAATIGSILRNDLRYIGYNVTGNAFKNVDNDKVEFWGDIDNNGSADEFKYDLGSKGEMDYTPNPDDRIIYRRLNGTTKEIGRGVTEFSLKYYTSNGALTTDKSKVKYMWVRIVVQGGQKIQQFYPTSIWESDFIIRNF